MLKKIFKKLNYELSHQSGRYASAPDFLTINITFSCNFRCQSCAVWQTGATQEANDAAWLDFFRKLPSQLPAETFLEFSGGEPLLKKGLILKALNILRPHFKNISLNTNGSLLDEAAAAALAEAGLSEVKISLYSLDPTVHDWLRGFDGARASAQRAIAAAEAAGLKTEIGVLITRQNIDSIPDLVNHFVDSRARINLQLLGEKYLMADSKNLSDNKMISELWPEVAQIDKFFTWLETADKSRIKNSADNLRLTKIYYQNPELLLKRRCFAGQKNIIVNPDGAVYLCFNGQSIGNAFIEDLGRLLIGNTAKKERLRYKACRKYCRAKGCNYSRGIKEYFLDFLG